MPLRHIRSNIVQSIRANRVEDLQRAAKQLGYHFFYANLAQTETKQDVLDSLVEQYMFPPHANRSFDALYDYLTDSVHKTNPQIGFVVVLEHIPTHSRFDRDAREQLLDMLRDAADYWGDRKISFRCFYSFAVARASRGERRPLRDSETQETMPTHKLLDVSPLALRMSSPFNSAYWLASSDDVETSSEIKEVEELV